MLPLLPGLEEWTVLAYLLGISFGVAVGAGVGLIGIKVIEWLKR